MASSVVEICNLALSAMGTRSTISDISEGSAEARQCALHYDAARDAVLAAAHWNFARKQVALALLKDATLATPDDVPQPWLYEYAYPSDAIQARYMMSTIDTSAASSMFGVASPGVSQLTGSPIRFLISLDVDDNGNDVKVILSNQEDAQLVYTKRVIDPNLFDSTFVQAFAYYLASKLVIALSGDKQLARDMFSVADRVTTQARVTNGNEGGPTVIDHLPDWLRVRGVESDFAGPPGSIFNLQPQSLVFIA